MFKCFIKNIYLDFKNDSFMHACGDLTRLRFSVVFLNRNLQSLVLLDNEIGIITAKKLFSIVLDALPQLTLFSLCDNEV